MVPLSFLIADDHPVILYGISELLEQNIHSLSIVTAHSPSATIEQLNIKAPDILITDYHMPQDDNFSDGMQFISYITRNFPQLKIIVLTMLSNTLITTELYNLGVNAVVSKNNSLKELLKAINTILKDKNYYPNSANKHPDSLISNLSPREFEVIRLFAQGFNISKIAKHLNRSIKTISAQKNTALKKLKLSNTQELITFCNTNNLLN